MEVNMENYICSMCGLEECSCPTCECCDYDCYDEDEIFDVIVDDIVCAEESN